MEEGAAGQKKRAVYRVYTTNGVWKKD